MVRSSSSSSSSSSSNSNNKMAAVTAEDSTETRATKKVRVDEEEEEEVMEYHPNLKQIIAACISPETTWNQLASLEENGVIETYLWPLFLSSAKDHPTLQQETLYPEAAFAIARLIQRKCHISSSNYSLEGRRGPFDFMYQTPVNHRNKGDGTDTNPNLLIVFQTFLHHLFEYYHRITTNDNKDNVMRQSSSVPVEVTILSFLIAVIQAIEPSSSSSTSSSDTPSIIASTLQSMTSIGLWTFMSPFIREYHLRSNSTFHQRWNKFIESNDDTKSSTTTTLLGFIPSLALRFLQRLRLVQKTYDDDDNKNTSGHQQGQSSLEQTFLPFFHMTLQFFMDLLSIPSTRRYLKRYLLSIHFSVFCTCSPLYSSSLAKMHVSPSQDPNKTNKNNMDLDDDDDAKDTTSTSNQLRILFVQLVQQLQEMETFGMDDITGAPYSTSQMKALYLDRASILQKMIHRHYVHELPDLMYASVDIVCGGTGAGVAGENKDATQTNAFLRKQLDSVVDWEKVLLDVAHRLRLMDPQDFASLWTHEKEERKREFVIQVLMYHHTFQPSELQRLQSLPLFPDESLLWNPHLVPPGHVSFVSPHVTTLALPKINTQFLTFGDYLVRFFTLLRLESAYEIRLDLVDVVRRMKPTASSRHFSYDATRIHVRSNTPFHGSFLHVPPMSEERLEAISNHKAKTECHGWARMGLELSTSSPLRIVKVSPPKLGESIPSQVIGEFCWDLSRCSEGLRKEWDDVCELDNLFLMAVDATAMTGGSAPIIDNDEDGGEKLHVPDEEDVTFPKRYGILAVRGCTVIEVRDDVGNVLNDSVREQYEEAEGTKPVSKSHLRFLKVELDSAQYAADISGRGSSLGSEVYNFLNVVVRRQGKENNFKAVLQTVRGMMVGAGSINKCIPPWLRPVFLGYGDPSSVSYNSKQMIAYAAKTAGISPDRSMFDCCDTFLDERHLRDSFPSCQVSVDGKGSSDVDTNSRKNYRLKVTPSDLNTTTVTAESYNRSVENQGNSVRFTPVQVEAIRSGLSMGLTLIVGPPGTGKTDVAVQIIANLFHSFPSERTVIITHSNAALNDIFEKVVTRGDIDERFMLRLGSGERDLQISPQFDFTKIGRVKHGLSRRMELLELVQLLSESLGVSGASERGTDGSPSYTCETAEYFRLHHIKKLRIQFESTVQSFGVFSCEEVGELFPFKRFFGIDEQNVSMNINEATEKCELIDKIFIELAEFRPLELLRSQKQRSDYLITKQARIIAMTCTYAAIMRSNLVDLGFKYENVLIEEAGQMLDIETFIPFLLQTGNVNGSSNSPSGLKRICLIGDHHQLPPVVKNTSLARHSRLDQSLFSRLIYQGVPTIQLNKQGRARPEIARLYSWRYKGLGNLNVVMSDPKFQRANAGLAYTHQLIDCGDFMGRGESTPTAFFYQNVGEAEYAVAIFQYMVMIGYPPEKITLLTTYNGQRDLLHDILSQRCGQGTPLANVRPGAVSTVDQYQGQQNDYVILSLVRTKTAGHLRDIRRLIVAMSRARLGLYLLCREKLFSSYRELKDTMDLLKVSPTKLTLVAGEHYPATRMNLDEIDDGNMFVVDDVVQMGKLVYDMQKDFYGGKGS